MELLLDFVIVGLSIGIVYGLVALGISLIFSGLDIVHFAHGEVYMIGAFRGRCSAASWWAFSRRCAPVT